MSQPSLSDRFFSRSVVMLAEHGTDGSFGFIVNKPANIRLSKVSGEFGDFDADLYLWEAQCMLTTCFMFIQKVIS